MGARNHEDPVQRSRTVCTAVPVGIEGAGSTWGEHLRKQLASPTNSKPLKEGCTNALPDETNLLFRQLEL